MTTDDTEPEQIKIMRRMQEMSGTRTELAAERTFLAVERTLSVWVRTALALMTLGIAIDRFSIFLEHASGVHVGHPPGPSALTTWGAVALIVLGILMALTAGLRYLSYVKIYYKYHRPPTRYGPFLAPVFALLVSLFGVALLVVLTLI